MHNSIRQPGYEPAREPQIKAYKELARDTGWGGLLASQPASRLAGHGQPAGSHGPVSNHSGEVTLPVCVFFWGRR